MKTYNILIITDHTNHSVQNSVYVMASEFPNHELVASVDIASLGIPQNESFLEDRNTSTLWVNPVDTSFQFTEDGTFFYNNLTEKSIEAYDFVWLRLPPPLSSAQLTFLKEVCQQQVVINNPSGIEIAGTKKYLLNFPQLCAPMQLCTTVDDIIDFTEKHEEIVLKPINSYGGKGIVKLDRENVWEGNKLLSKLDFFNELHKNPFEYLAVKFLKNVHEGDKRIVVINGEILGATLRMPASDSWLCNISSGGTPADTIITPEELEMVHTVNPFLKKLGIAMYGLDTLTNDAGKRILSEINVTSVGGVYQFHQKEGRPPVQKAVNELLNFFIEKANEN
ncbi:hypothetical protein EZY14_005035 [Kordia sp. TARA_039_SRF]|nr:hypothetical protein EZY14_005035 [Kordia sp. TARA_039_SRF]